MKRARIISGLLIVFFLLYSGIACAQKTDSLLNLLKAARGDTHEITLWRNLGRTIRVTSPDSAVLAFGKSLRLAEKLGRKKDKAIALFEIGRVHENKEELAAARRYYEDALFIMEELGDKPMIAKLCLGIGHMYLNEFLYPRALEYDLRSMKLFEELKDTLHLAVILGNIGSVYVDQGEYTKARKYFDRALVLAQKMGDKEDIANQYGNTGTSYYYEGNFEKARDYYFRAYGMFKEIRNDQRSAVVLGNIGACYVDQAKITPGKEESKKLFDKGQEYHERALKINTELDLKYGQLINLGNLGSLFAETGQYKKGEEMLKRTLALAKEVGSTDDERLAHENLSKLYEKTGRYNLALSHYKDFITARDSIFNEENTKKTVRAEMNYEFEKKEAAAKLEQEKKEAVAEAEKKKQRIVLLAISGFGLLVLGFAVFAYRSFLQKKKANIEISKQKHIIEEKQKEILDSIHYAKRIQQSLMTNEKTIHRIITKLGR